MSGNPIPTTSRLIVGHRDLGRCVRCGGKANEWHHRRRRGVKTPCTHAACNGITLCSMCHPWAHAYPREARGMGWIVSAHDDPHEAPVYTFLWGWVLLNHDGTFEQVSECEQCETVTYTAGGLCMACLRADVCCSTAQIAAMELCGCGGAAATLLHELIEKAERRAS